MKPHALALVWLCISVRIDPAQAGQPGSADPAADSGIGILTTTATDQQGKGGEAVMPEALKLSSADAKPHKVSGFFDFNYYWDTRDLDVASIYVLANLQHDFTFFQLLNLEGQFGQASEREDWKTFYTELNLWHPIAKDHELLKPFDWEVQFADGTFVQDVLRLGIQWRFQDTPGPIGDFLTNVLKLRYSIYFHLIETDGTGIQLEHVYFRSFCDDRLYFRGFADHDINDGGSSSWVTGNQIGLRVFDQFHLVAEHRYNSFLPSEFKSGWRLGLEYNIRF